MTLAAIVFGVAAIIGFGFKPAFAALDRWAERQLEPLVEAELGPKVDWEQAEAFWAAQGKDQLR